MTGSRWTTSAVAVGLIMLAAGALVWIIFDTEPTAQRETATKRTAMLVEVETAKLGSYQPTVVATGTVRAEKEVQLSPQVSGRIVTRAEDFTPGGFVAAGQVLLGIERQDYENAVQQRRAGVSQARSQLRIEMGRQDVAREEFDQIFRDGLDAENEGLFLRKPQLAAARTAVMAAQAALDQAELELQRTVITAPFAAHVLSRNVDVGTRVTPSSVLGRLVATERYWVVTDVPLAQRGLLGLDSNYEQAMESQEQPRAWVRSRTWPQGVRRQGRVERLIGALDERTRMARVLVTVDDPLGRSALVVEPARVATQSAVEGHEEPIDRERRPSLMIGEFVEVGLRGQELDDVVRLRRGLLRDGNTVWLMKEGALHIQPIDVAARDERFAYVSQGIAAGDQVVVTNLATVAEGAPLRKKQVSAASGDTTQ